MDVAQPAGRERRVGEGDFNPVDGWAFDEVDELFTRSWGVAVRPQ
jgi:hypothetical protein